MYRDRIAAHVDANFSVHGLRVYTEVPFGKTIMGKNRHIDVFVLDPESQVALGIECKLQNSRATTDEKIPYALQDLEAMWIPGWLAGGVQWLLGCVRFLIKARTDAGSGG